MSTQFRWAKVWQILGAGLLASLAVAGAALAGGSSYDRGNSHHNQLILRADISEIGRLEAQYPIRVLGTMQHDDGAVFLIEGKETWVTAEDLENQMLGDPAIRSLVRVELASLPGGYEQLLAVQSYPDDISVDLAKTGTLSTPCYDANVREPLWRGYAGQRAAELIRLQQAHLAGGCGKAVVAVIDTGVDPDHPLLSEALVPGYDFLLEEAGFGSEWTSVDQSVRAILDHQMMANTTQSVRAILDGDVEVIRLDASMALIEPADYVGLEGEELPLYFGHGTMVAGLVRMVAPAARIMPLRVFNSQGEGHLFDILRAIYWAVDHGADVINMSFSMESFSPELLRAIHYARIHGVVCVAAAGNRSERILVYPASYGDSVGVASTTMGDTLSPFSNYGYGVAAIAAPGSGLISIYPGGLFAAGWGTSFSSPLVAGAVALLEKSYPNNDTAAYHSKLNALSQGSVKIQSLAGDIGSGRLDALATVQAAKN